MNNDIDFQIGNTDDKIKKLEQAKRTFSETLAYLRGNKDLTGDKFPYIFSIKLGNAFWGQAVREDSREINLEGLDIKLDEAFLVGIIEKTSALIAQKRAEQINNLDIKISQLQAAKNKL